MFNKLHNEEKENLKQDTIYHRSWILSYVPLNMVDSLLLVLPLLWPMPPAAGTRACPSPCMEVFFSLSSQTYSQRENLLTI